jgi:hypothetical protein
VFTVFVHSPLSVDLSIRVFMVPNWKRVGAMAIVFKSIEGTRGPQFLTSSRAGWLLFIPLLLLHFTSYPERPLLSIDF